MKGKQMIVLIAVSQNHFPGTIPLHEFLFSTFFAPLWSPLLWAVSHCLNIWDTHNYSGIDRVLNRRRHPAIDRRLLWDL